MVCYFVRRLIQAYLGDGLAPGDADRIHRHCEKCASCTAALREAQEAARLVGSLPRHAVSAADMDSLLSRVRARGQERLGERLLGGVETAPIPVKPIRARAVERWEALKHGLAVAGFRIFFRPALPAYAAVPVAAALLILLYRGIPISKGTTGAGQEVPMHPAWPASPSDGAPRRMPLTRAPEESAAMREQASPLASHAPRKPAPSPSGAGAAVGQGQSTDRLSAAPIRMAKAVPPGATPAAGASTARAPAPPAHSPSARAIQPAAPPAGVSPSGPSIVGETGSTPTAERRMANIAADYAAAPAAEGAGAISASGAGAATAPPASPALRRQVPDADSGARGIIVAAPAPAPAGSHPSRAESLAAGASAIASETSASQQREAAPPAQTAPQSRAPSLQGIEEALSRGGAPAGDLQAQAQQKAGPSSRPEQRMDQIARLLAGKPEEAREMARALGRARDRRAVAALIRALREHPDGSVREAAADALADIKTPEALAALRAAAGSDTPAREPARRALARLRR